MHRLLLNHLKHVTGSRYGPWYSGPCASVSHCCSAGTLGFDHACIRHHIFWNFGYRPHPDSVEHLLEHLHPLFSLFCFSCFVTLGCFVNSLCLPADGYVLVSWVLGSQPLAVLLSSRPLGTCFINQIQCFQCQFLLRNHCCCSIHGTSSILTSRASRTHRPLVTMEVAFFTHNWNRPILCRCIESAAPALSRASPCRLDDAFNVVSFLHGSDISSLFLHTTIVCV